RRNGRTLPSEDALTSGKRFAWVTQREDIEGETPSIRVREHTKGRHRRPIYAIGQRVVGPHRRQAAHDGVVLKAARRRSQCSSLCAVGRPLLPVARNAAL